LERIVELANDGRLPKSAPNLDRVEWTATRNLDGIDDPRDAALVMRAHADELSSPQLLGCAALTWTWSGLAALAHEVTAAGCVLAAAALGSDPAAAERQVLQQTQQQQEALARNAELVVQRDASC
jgi:hypothetical protein